MRLICPHCMNGVAVPDDAAGKEATCPNCGKSFPTPSRYTAAVTEAASAIAGAAPAPPPGLVPPAPPQAPAPHAPAAPPGFVPPASGFLPPPSAAEPPAPGGYTHSCGITISPKVVAWMPAVLLTAVFLCTFFPWVGTYAGSTPVFSQRMWGAMFGGVKRDFRLEEANTVPGGWLDKVRSDWELLVPFTLALLLALAFAWAERGLGAADPRKIPPLAKLWPWRNSVIAGLAAMMLVLLLVQVLNGFGMERAIRKHIGEQFAERRAKVASSKAETAKLEYDEEQELAKYNLERTWWLYFALGGTALTVLSVMTHVALDNRGNKPPPKLVLHY